jgi:hypothetical protein
VSAREDLYLFAMVGKIHEDGNRAMAVRKLDAHRAEVLSEDGQAYDGELAMLRTLVRTLRVIVRYDDHATPEVRRLLHQHLTDERAAYQDTGDPAGARQAALLAAILQAPARRWKPGRAVTALREAGYHPLSPGTAAGDLSALAAAGHLVRHESTGVRWYEVARRTGGASRG